MTQTTGRQDTETQDTAAQDTQAQDTGRGGEQDAANQNGSGGEKSSRSAAKERLLSEAQSFVFNKANSLVGSLGDKVTGTIGKVENLDAGALKTGVKSLAGGDSPAKAGLKAGGEAVKNKIGGLFGGKSSGAGKTGVKATHITEQIDIGLPVSVVYNQWTQFEEFGSFTKGVQSVEQQDETTTTWKAKVAWSTREWKSTITEQIPDDRIAWRSEGAKGTVDGVVTFHELAPNLTRVIVELEYTPKGLFEKTGNLWRAQGRRVRLDLKHFRRFVMMQGHETGAWRGRIEDSKVTQSPEDVEQQEQGDRDQQEQHGQEGRQERQGQQGRQGGQQQGRQGQQARRQQGGQEEEQGQEDDRDDRGGRGGEPAATGSPGRKKEAAGSGGRG